MAGPELSKKLKETLVQAQKRVEADVRGKASAALESGELAHLKVGGTTLLVDKVQATAYASATTKEQKLKVIKAIDQKRKAIEKSMLTAVGKGQKAAGFVPRTQEMKNADKSVASVRKFLSASKSGISPP